jgi:hypothetical protein
MTSKSITKTAISTWLIPSLAATTFIILPVIVMINPAAMLQDPGVGWHLKTGQYMLDHKIILDHDIFSFTRPGQTWIVKEWLFQYLAAWLIKIGGLPLFSAVSALIYGSLPLMLYKRMVRNNSNVYISLILIFVAFFGLAGHCHARPHIFTYFFFTILLNIIFLYDSKQISSYSLYAFIPVMVLWCNLHGGFVVGIVCAGLAFLVAAYQFIRSGNSCDLERAKNYLLFSAGMMIATIINPWGWNLHLFILKFLSYDLLHRWIEFRSPNFANGGFTEVIFLYSILIILLLIRSKNTKISLLESIFIVFFMYQSFYSMRHIFLFFLLTIPIIARELTTLIPKSNNWFTKRSKRIAEEQKAIKGDWIYIPLICLIFIALSLKAPSLFKNDLYGINLSSEAGRFINLNIDKFDRTFNTVDIGGALIYHFWPDIKVFSDDRLDYYGEKFFLEKYFKVTDIKSNWSDILQEERIKSAIITIGPLAVLMEESGDWDMVYKDEKVFIFFRKGMDENG